MKLVIERKQLLPALSAVIGAVARKSTLEVLTYLHVVGDGEALTLTASNLELTLRVQIPEVQHSAFTALWPAKRMMEIVKSYPENSHIGIAQDEPDKMVVKCGRSRFSLLTLDPQDYPLIDQGIGFDHEVLMDQEQLLSCLVKTDFAMAKNDVRYYLNGLLFHGIESQVRLVATDGHRLAKTHHRVMPDQVFSESWQTILPADAINEIKKACHQGPCQISVCNNLVQLQFSDRILFVKQIDGRFPDYLRVIPVDFKRKATMDRIALLEALQRIRLVLEDHEGVQFDFAESQLTLAGGVGTERAEDQIDIEYSGDPLTIGLNGLYILDVLRAIESTRIQLCCNDAGDSIKVVDLDHPEDDFVIMPIKL